MQGDVGGYRVLRRVRGSSGDFEEVGQTGRLVTSYTDETVTPGAKYHYRVKAFNGAGDSEASNQVSADVLRRPVNVAATGAPAVTGTAQVYETLTADTSAITDANGTERGAFTYQWLADDTDISGATAATYTVAAADLAKTIKVRVSITDDAGYVETLTSAATAAVEAASPGASPPDVVAAPAVAAPAAPQNLALQWLTHDGVTLVWDAPAGTVDSYQILRRIRHSSEDFEVVGETGSAATIHTDTTAAPSTSYTYRVRAVNAGGFSGVSRYLNLITLARPPANRAATGAPTISGSARVDGTVTADTTAIADRDGLRQRVVRLPVAGRRHRHLRRHRSQPTPSPTPNWPRPSKCASHSPTTTATPRPSPAPASDQWATPSARHRPASSRPTTSNKPTSNKPTTRSRRSCPIRRRRRGSCSRSRSGATAFA